MAAPKPYRKLPGTGYRRVIPLWAIVLLLFVIGIFALLFQGRRVQLWEGEEHLLLVEWDGNREYYKRFSYRDIQAFIVRKTIEGRAISALLAGVTILMGVGALSVTGPFQVFFLCLLALFGIILLSNFLSGPTCKCVVRTAVQTEELFPLTRLPRYRKVMERIRPRIVEAQGQLTPEELAVQLREVSTLPTAQQPAQIQPAAQAEDDPNVPPRIL
jgi:hypothetical protein